MRTFPLGRWLMLRWRDGKEKPWMCRAWGKFLGAQRHSEGGWINAGHLGLLPHLDLSNLLECDRALGKK